MRVYRNIPKFSDARKICCNLPKTQTKRPNLKVFHQKDANGIANNVIIEDPVCPDLFVRNLWIIMLLCLQLYQHPLDVSLYGSHHMNICSNLNTDKSSCDMLSSSLKPLGQSKPNFMWILLDKRGYKFIKMILVT